MKRTLVILALFTMCGLFSSRAQAQQRSEVKLDVFDLMFGLVGVSYEYPISRKLGLEAKLGYDFYQSSSFYPGGGEFISSYTQYALGKLALRRYISNQKDLYGFGFGFFAEIQLETRVGDELAQAHMDFLGKEYELERPSYLFIGGQGFYKHLWHTGWLVEVNFEPFIDIWGPITDRAIGIGLNIEIKAGYRFGSVVLDES